MKCGCLISKNRNKKKISDVDEMILVSSVDGHVLTFDEAMLSGMFITKRKRIIYEG